jgi:hypothetical protein
VIDLRFVDGRGRLSFVPDASLTIEIFSAGHFSHVDAVVPATGIDNCPWEPGSLVGERSDKVGGKPAGLQCRPYGYVSVRNAVLFHLPATAEEETAFWAFMYVQEGHRYDKLGIVAFLFNSNWHTPGTFFCSAAILDALQSADWISPLYSPYNKVVPVALADLTCARGATWEVDPRWSTAAADSSVRSSVSH